MQDEKKSSFITEVQLEQKAVPTEVFGSIGGDDEGQVMGAKERLSRKRKK